MVASDNAGAVPSTIREIVLVFLSFGIFLSWIGTIHYSHVIGFSRMDAIPFASATSLVNAVCFAAVFTLYLRGGSIAYTRLRHGIVCSIALFGTFSLQFELLYFFIPIAVGCAVAWFRLAFAEYFVAYGGKKTLLVFGLSYITCSITYYGLTLLPGAILQAATLALPLIFTTLLCLAQNPSPSHGGATRRFNTSIQHFWKLAVLVFLFSALFDLTETYQIFGQESYFAWSYATGFLIAGLFALGLIAVLPKNRSGIERFLYVAMIASMLMGISAFYLTPVVSDAALLMTVQTLGGYGFVALFQAVAAHIAKERNMPAGLVFAGVLCLQRFGNSLGELVGQGAMSGAVPRTSVYIGMSILILIVFIVAVLVLLAKDNQPFLMRVKGGAKAKERFGLDGGDHGTSDSAQGDALDDPRKRLVQMLGTDHGLTMRETEIFILLVEGKNSQEIQKKLHISANTVKTHVKHVYQKFGVHGKGELIEYAESFLR